MPQVTLDLPENVYDRMVKMALMLLKRETSVKVGLQAKRLRAGWHNDYLLKVLNT